jgi:hypothetical protein
MFEENQELEFAIYDIDGAESAPLREVPHTYFSYHMHDRIGWWSCRG